MPVIKNAVIEKFKAFQSAEKSKNNTNFTKLDRNMIRRVSLLKNSGGLNSTAQKESLQKLINQSNQTKFLKFGEAMFAFWKHSQKIAMKVLAERSEKKNTEISRKRLNSRNNDRSQDNSDTESSASSITALQLPTDQQLPDVEKAKKSVRIDESQSSELSSKNDQDPESFAKQLDKLRK